jgi:hypothetical protein
MLAATCYFEGCPQSSRIHVHPVRLLLKLGLELVGKRRKNGRGGEQKTLFWFFSSKINFGEGKVEFVSSELGLHLTDLELSEPLFMF